MTVHHFNSDGVDIAYIDEGGQTGEPAKGPILLIHGFASNFNTNWVATGWVSTLVKDGYRVIALDNRGHGQSGKPHDPDAYSPQIMAEDARRLLDYLGIGAACVMGYSMGARITAVLGLNHPDRVRSAVFGGLGINMVRGFDNSDIIADALLTPSPDTITDPVGQTFRAFADQTGSDLKALAACIRASRLKISGAALEVLRMPVLVCVGTEDDTGGDPHELAAFIPNGQAFDIDGRDHMKAVGDKTYKAAVLAFLKDHQ